MIIISGILSYSGISAKARAMGGKLLKKEHYEQLASCASGGEAGTLMNMTVTEE